MLSTEEIDRELDSRAKEVAAMSATMVELDNHPGLTHVRHYPPTGLTAQRWAVIENVLAQLWQDLGRMTTILDAVQAKRGRARLDDQERAELTRLLRERHYEVSRQAVPLAQRKIGGSAETVEYVGLADTAERMQATYPAVVEFLDSVDAANNRVARGLAPLQKQLENAGAPVPPELAELLTLSANDPLSLERHDVDARLAVIADKVRTSVAEAAELAALQANWPLALAEAAARLNLLQSAVTEAARARIEAERTVITGAFPVRDDAEPELRAALAALSTPDPAALRALRMRIDDALHSARHDAELAQGLLDRRSELKGRLTAYEAKAARLGLGEDRDLLSCAQIASGLLSRRPCDLRAVTRAVADYQELLTEKRGSTR
ncbi:hypothetical protein BVC93_01025 [Mycobacterium sp. MS1601]|uniref:hypothetical protein n=1 Tax=Mycobacterium sp. MS1601 TaxID=1936029 RepID=UPI0009793C44|nr:hypothetical protein [Mycobacterium sp. MS1601]AQA01238.1 hypothetical protein BVC93_01025 [Mycobacterium sp. MS1601]